MLYCLFFSLSTCLFKQSLSFHFPSIFPIIFPLHPSIKNKKKQQNCAILHHCSAAFPLGHVFPQIIQSQSQEVLASTPDLSGILNLNFTAGLQADRAQPDKVCQCVYMAANCMDMYRYIWLYGSFSLKAWSHHHLQMWPIQFIPMEDKWYK